MRRALVLRTSHLALVTATFVAGSLSPVAQPTQSHPAPHAERTTLQIGMFALWHDRAVTLSPATPNHQLILSTCARCATLVLTQPADIRATDDAVTLTAAGKTGNTQRVSTTGPITLTAHGESVTLQNPVTISAHAGVLVIAVTLPVESYVARVVASESGPADSEESLKTLAIVVRSFALHEAHGHADYDLCDSTHCQLLHWGNNGSRQAAAHAATLATAGETLWFHGQRALAYFGKDCGGQTASPAEIWPNARALPYLPSRPDPNCGGGGSTWASDISRADLSAALAARGLARSGWKSLTIAQRGTSGRVLTLKLDGTSIPAEDFRLAIGQALGWNRIPSTWFEVSQQGDRFLFHGRGWGNGVGLCQKGAAAMASQHHTAAQVLDQYFPGAQSADESTGQSWQRFTGEGFTLESLSPDDATFLPALARAHAAAVLRSGLTASTRITVRAFATTPAFRNATLAPGWVAAFTEGAWIGTQPLRILAARHLLDSTMRHEFLHALIEQEASPKAPLWLREGLVEAWADPSNSTSVGHPSMSINAVDTALTHATTEHDSAAAHRAAQIYTAQVLAHYGRAQVLAWLRSGVPSEVLAELRKR